MQSKITFIVDYNRRFWRNIINKVYWNMYYLLDLSCLLGIYGMLIKLIAVILESDCKSPWYNNVYLADHTDRRKVVFWAALVY